MVVRRALALVLTVLALGACSQTQKNAFVHMYRPSLPKSSITAVTLSRLGCRWSCHTYTLTFSRGDIATYEGKRNVDKIGKYDGDMYFGLIAAWLDEQDVDNYAGKYGTFVSDSEYVKLEISRTDRTVVIYSADIYSLPIKVQGIIAALDGFGEGVRWKSVSPLDSYLGYFLNDNSPDELFALSTGSNSTAPGLVGSLRIVHVDKCSDDGFASDQFYFDAHLIGSRAVGQERSYNVDIGKYGPENPIAFAREPGGLSVGVGPRKRFYHRVTWNEYEAAFDALRAKSDADCPSDHPK